MNLVLKLNSSFLKMLLVLGFLFSCAHSPTDPAVTPVIGDASEPTQFRVADLAETAKPVAEELEVIPTEINSSVEKWINYFQGRGRPHMERYLLRSDRKSVV